MARTERERPSWAPSPTMHTGWASSSHSSERGFVTLRTWGVWGSTSWLILKPQRTSDAQGLTLALVLPRGCGCREDCVCMRGRQNSTSQLFLVHLLCMVNYRTETFYRSVPTVRPLKVRPPLRARHRYNSTNWGLGGTDPVVTRAWRAGREAKRHSSVALTWLKQTTQPTALASDSPYL